jgi:hypothetical protein
MARWAPETALWLAGLLLAGLLPAAWSAPLRAELSPYEARYSIIRNGKIIGKLEVALEQNGERWELRSDGGGTHGLARVLAAQDREQVIGEWDGVRFRPSFHRRHTRVAAIDDVWETTFDWDAGQATVVHDGKHTFVLPFEDEAFDPLSLKLEMRRRLALDEPDLSFMMVEEDDIEEQNFRILETEWMETSLGCLDTTPIEKIRRNNRRYTRAWHAPALGNIEVRVEHGKTGGDHLEMRITELTLNGETVAARPGCAARQSASTAETLGGEG